MSTNLSQPPEKAVAQTRKGQKSELSEEDLALQQRINQLCESIKDQDQQIAWNALNLLSNEVRQATSTMASVPKAYRFLKDQYPELKNHYQNLSNSTFKSTLANFLSVLATTFDEKNSALIFLLEGSNNDYLNWGFEYLSHISDLIGSEYEKRLENKESANDLLKIMEELVSYFMHHNSEVVAIDLLMEMDQLPLILQYANQNNQNRIVEYLNSCSFYGVDQLDTNKILKISYKICLAQNQLVSALRLAFKLGDHGLISEVINACQDRTVKKQLAFDLARQRIPYEFNDEELDKIVGNQMLSSFYLQMAKELEVSEPKHPDQIYKTYLEDKKSSAQIDSAKQNLANTYVNAFVNIASGKDSLMLQRKEGDTAWIYKVKNEGLIAATASLGMIFQFDPENGQIATSEYMDLTDGFAKMGANLAVGMYSQGVIDENETAKALLVEQIQGKDELSRLGAIIGVGLAYAGTHREEFLDILIPIITDTSLSVEVSAFASLSIGLIFVSQLNEDALSAIIETIMYRSDPDKSATVSRYFSVALGLLCLGQQENCEPTIDALRTIQHPIGKYAEVMVLASAYLGTGNELFNLCSEPGEEKTQEYKGVAVLGMAMIAMQDQIGSEMLQRSLNHILQFGDIISKRAVPLAFATLSVSDPKITLQDILAKLAYDFDDELAQKAILSLGIIGCGTNNSRIAGILRQLATYYSLDSTSNHLFCVRLAQGFLHTGKGLMTLQPFYSDNFLQSKVGVSGLVVFMNSCMDMEHIINGKYHYSMYYLTLSLYPRMLFTINEQLQNQPLSVRVGQALDTVGIAGQPKRITGFQTHTSPVVISYGERAEIANEEYLTVADSVLENIVIVRKNENYVQEEIKIKKKT